jgi:predicted RNase H-like HicB family nuclease
MTQNTQNPVGAARLTRGQTADQHANAQLNTKREDLSQVRGPFRDRKSRGCASSLVCGYPVGMPDIPGTLTAALHREEDWYIAQCLEVDVASQGHTIDEALTNLAKAVELYLEEVNDPVGHLTATPLVTTFRLPAA